MFTQTDCGTTRKGLLPTTIIALCMAAVDGRAQGLAEPSTQPGTYARIRTPKEDTRAYCAWVEAVADSEAALLFSPTLFGTATLGRNTGVGNDGGDHNAAANTSGSLLPESGRVTVGLTYSLAGLFRGFATQDRARAQCESYQSTSRLQGFVLAHSRGQSAPGLRAQLAILEKALPTADAAVVRTELNLKEGTATLDELLAVERRAEELHAQTSRVRRDLQLTTDQRIPPVEAVLEEMRAGGQAQRKLHQEESALRGLRGWDFTFGAGYDQIVGIDNNNVPLFATATLSFNLGLPFQGSSERRALNARLERGNATVNGIGARIEQSLELLRIISKEETARHARVKLRLSRLQARYENFQKMADSRARRRFLRALWFELTMARAESAYLERHLDELASLFSRSTE